MTPEEVRMFLLLLLFGCFSVQAAETGSSLELQPMSKKGLPEIC